ncbi:MFS transporter [Actinoplanes sp. NPDC049802]|uniref:MFS transporter n=1 Tax=Actinoplanes sp. NPDC049802 TaxID=3154742 RepID=UPI0033F42539
MTVEAQRARAWSPWRTVVAFGLVSLTADMVYEGARSIYGPLLASLGASAAAVGLITGAGEAAALLLRLVSGPLADHSRRYWTLTVAGYALTAVCVPLLAVTPALGAAGLLVAAGLILAERLGKAIRSPAKSALLADAAGQVGMGRGLGVHKALDQVGAFAGPLLVAAIVVAAAGRLWPALAVLAVPGAVAMVLLFVLRIRSGPPGTAAPSRPSSGPADEIPVRPTDDLPHSTVRPTRDLPTGTNRPTSNIVDNTNQPTGNDATGTSGPTGNDPNDTNQPTGRDPLQDSAGADSAPSGEPRQDGTHSSGARTSGTPGNGTRAAPRESMATVAAALPRRFWWFAAAAALCTGGLVTYGLIGFHLTEAQIVAPPLVPVLYAAAMGAAALAALATGVLYDRAGGRTLTVLPLLVASGAALSFRTGPAAVVAGILLWGAAVGVQDSTVKAIVADLVPRERRATAYGMFAAVQGAAALAGGAVAGVLYQRSLTGLVAAVAASQAVALLILLTRLRDR